MFSEPSVASNGRIVLYTGNIFVKRSDNAGTDWDQAQLDPNMGGFNHIRSGGGDNTGDNDVIYSSKIHKFIWYRQGYDGRFSLSTSIDTHMGSANIRRGK